MKLLHTADWHLGKRLESFSRLPEQKEVLAEICEIAERENVDAVVIAGDIYDQINPPVEAIELFYQTVKKLSNNGVRPVIAIAGNHDSPERIEAPDPLARACGIILAGSLYTHVPTFTLDSGMQILRSEPGFLELKLPNCSTPLRLLLTPYVNEYRLRTFLGTEKEGETMQSILANWWQTLATRYCDNKGVNMLVAHLLMMNQGENPPQESDDEKPIMHAGVAQLLFTEHIPREIQYTALGHLHRFHEVGKSSNPIVYSSSPLAYSMSEAFQDKYIVIIEAEAENVSYQSVKLNSGRKLRRGRFESVAEALHFLQTYSDEYIELTICTDRFLTAMERKALQESHSFLVNVIPQIKLTPVTGNAPLTLDLSQSREELFIEFFKHHQGGQIPSEELLRLFHEVTSVSTD